MKFPFMFLPVFALVLIAGAECAAAQVKPDASKPPVESPSPSTPKNPEGVGAAVDPTKYLIGPEDILFIKTWREPDFTLPVAVRPDGKITIPLVGDLQAAGLTPLQLTAELKERLAKYINNPDVTVMITDVRSKKYYMDGEFSRPGQYPLVTPITVREAISIAGGFKEFANPRRIKIVRADKVFRFNYKEVMSGKKLEQNILLESGDHILIP